MNKKILALAAISVLSSLGVPQIASAQSISPYIGQVILMATDFCPAGWVALDGRAINLDGNEVLFSVAGHTISDADAAKVHEEQTFKLPSTVGKLIVGSGAKPGVTEPEINVKEGTTKVPSTYALTLCVATSGAYPNRP